MPYPVFVYGTLKRKHINHILLEGVGIARIRPARLCGVELYDIADPMRPYPYPALLRGMGQVLGELVDLTQLEDGLLVLDHLECEGSRIGATRAGVGLRLCLERFFTAHEGQTPLGSFMEPSPQTFGKTDKNRVDCAYL
jgi:gamma-glutamylcyclotransferase (GGCT)/AIG2-like uncharacterized protein YtfP